MSIVDSTVTLRQLRFSNNQALLGGALHVYGQSKVLIEDSQFTGNSATHDGGAIHGPVDVYRSTFTNNSADGRGGAMSDVRGLLQEVTFLGNVAEEGGGALVTDCSGLTEVEDCLFDANTATHSGGAIRATGGTLRIRTTDFTANHTGSTGGALVSNGVTEVSWSHFATNTAHNGGAMSLGGNSSTVVHNSTFENNVADRMGGAISAYEAEVALAGVLVVNNSTSSTDTLASGGGLATYGGEPVRITNSTFWGNRSHSGGALSLGSSYGRPLDVQIENSIVQANHPCRSQVLDICRKARISYCSIPYPWDSQGSNNITQAPTLISGTYRPARTSLTIDAGNRALLPTDLLDLDADDYSAEPLPVDLDGRSRVLGCGLDMGCYESSSSRCP
jgi:predicted outer membrane repeat protein